MRDKGERCWFNSSAVCQCFLVLSLRAHSRCSSYGGERNHVGQCVSRFRTEKKLLYDICTFIVKFYNYINIYLYHNSLICSIIEMLFFLYSESHCEINLN